MNNDIKDSGIWTNVKTETGFILNVNLRRDTLDQAYTELKTFILKNKFQPYEKSFNKGTPKPVEYVENRVCPLDGGKLIKPPVGTNRPIKCANGKYDFATKTTVGCQFTEWEKPAHVAEVEKVMARNTDTYNPDEVPDNIDF